MSGGIPSNNAQDAWPDINALNTGHAPNAFELNGTSLQAKRFQRQAVPSGVMQIGFEPSSAHSSTTQQAHLGQQSASQMYMQQSTSNRGEPQMQERPFLQADLPTVLRRPAVHTPETIFSPNPHNIHSRETSGRSMDPNSGHMRMVDNVIAFQQRESSTLANAQQMSNNRYPLIPDGNQPGPSRVQQGGQTFSPQQRKGVPIPKPHQRSPRLMHYDDSSHVFRRMLPPNFGPRPRFVPNHVSHFSQQYDELGAKPINLPSAPANVMTGHQGHDNLKLFIDPTPAHEALRHASAGIGRLVGLLPATDLLDREANTFQTALLSMVRLLDESNARAQTAEAKVSEQEARIKALEVMLSSINRQLNAITLGLGASQSGVQPWGNVLQDLHQYVVEAQKRDKWLSGKIAEYDQKFALLLDKSAKVGVDREETEEHGGPIQERTNDDTVADYPHLLATAKASQEVVKQLSSVANRGSNGLTVETRETQTSQLPLLNVGQQTEETMGDTLPEPPQIDTLDPVNPSETRNIAGDSEPMQERDGSNRVTLDAGNEITLPDAEGAPSEKEQTNETQEIVRLPDEGLGQVKDEEEQDEIESERGALIAETLPENVSGGGHEDYDTSALSFIAPNIQAQESIDVSAPFNPVTFSPVNGLASPYSALLKEQGQKRKRCLETSFYIRNGNRVEAIVISDGETDDDSADDEGRREEENNHNEPNFHRAKVLKGL